MCKVSVIVPVYNVEKYLPCCLDSLVKQTLKDIEIICIDDGSTDKSGDILDQYAEKDVRIHVVHQTNGGYGKAMNIGLRLAQGKYIGVVESDDFARADMFEILYKVADQEQVQIVKSNYYRYWSVPKEKTKKEPLVKHLPQGQMIHPWAYQRLFRIQPSIWSGLYLRDFIEQNEICFLETSGAAYQDTSFTFKVLAVAEKMVLIADALLYYRQDNENSSIHSAQKAFDICAEYKEINQFLNQKPAYQALYKIRNQAMFHTYLWNYVRLAPEFHRQFLYQMHQDFLQLKQSGQLQHDDFNQVDWRMLNMILEIPELFVQKEAVILPWRQKMPNRVYRALLIGRTAGWRAMVQAVLKRLMRK